MRPLIRCIFEVILQWNKNSLDYSTLPKYISYKLFHSLLLYKLLFKKYYIILSVKNINSRIKREANSLPFNQCFCKNGKTYLLCKNLAYTNNEGYFWRIFGGMMKDILAKTGGVVKTISSTRMICKN